MDERRISYCWGNFSSAERSETVESGDDSYGVVVREQSDIDGDADKVEGDDAHGQNLDAISDEHEAGAGRGGRKRGRKSRSATARAGKAAKGKSGRRRNTTIKTVENLGAAATRADAASAENTATNDAGPGGQSVLDDSVRNDDASDVASDAASEMSSDAAADAVLQASGITLGETDADDTGDDARQERDATPDQDAGGQEAGDQETGDSLLFDDQEDASQRPVSDPLARAYPSSDGPQLLDIADDNGGDSLDLAEFVIQAAVSGEDDDTFEPAYQPPSWSPVDRGKVPVDTAAAPGAHSEPKIDGDASSDDREALLQDARAADHSDDRDNVGARLSKDEDLGAASDVEGPRATAKAGISQPSSGDASGRLDHRYVSPDLRIPMIDEDDIPSVEAVYLFDDKPATGSQSADVQNTGLLSEAVDTDALAAEADDDAGHTGSSGPADVPGGYVAYEAKDFAPGAEADDTIKIEERGADRDVGPSVDDAASAGLEHQAGADDDGEADDVALRATAGSEEFSADTADTAQGISARKKSTGDADATTIRRPTASALAPTAESEKAGEGEDDVNASRLFSALSLKRLAIPPHVFEARQRVNVISGLAIIAALGFVGWYFSAPSTIERQLIVETKDPSAATAKTASATVTKDKGAETLPGDRLVGASGERTGLIYRPLKKVETAALTAIGDLEYKITPSKFHRIVRVIKGDTFVAVLVRAGVDSKEAAQAIRSMRSIYDPRKLRIGREIKVAFGVAGPEQTRFLGYRFDSSYDRSVHVARQQSGEFASAEVKKNVSESFSRVDGKITTSLFGSGMKAGAPAQTMVQMIHLFSFAVDFQRDLRGGEPFQILFRSHRDEAGRIVRTGEIAYASLTVRGRTHKLYWYRPNKKGGRPTYLNEKGQGNRKALMKTPIDGARLTSNFGYRRHPILGYSKLHTGADFGARSGTPIYAAGDGTIVKIGWHGGYGRYVRIRHGKVYQTAYAHMSRFRSGLKVGSRVKQGETIGYVGTTGRSTGPHLHYEVLKSGKHVNPMTITLPSRKRLQGRALQRFLAYRKSIDTRFAGLKNEKSKKQDAAVQAVKSDGGAGCKNGIRIDPLDQRPCN